VQSILKTDGYFVIELRPFVISVYHITATECGNLADLYPSDLQIKL
jgi:hypothetical protein